ncbi:unnamed protein product [Protopolystoma xenopodis]|uniref:Uncharacterized protein n=1 Tax=Protopolystoma xenopodis TaxID=117903 RepID=A0A448WXN6_9PLAT|nr:unnamed protein product [Protopolystoma xenopodis]
MPLYEVISRDILRIPPASSAARSRIRRVTFFASRRETTIQIRDPRLLGTEPEFGFFWRSALSGILSGGAAQFISSPTDLIKVVIHYHLNKTFLKPQIRLRITLR